MRSLNQHEITAGFKNIHGKSFPIEEYDTCKLKGFTYSAATKKVSD